MFIFTIGDRVLGVCDYDHLKENVEKIWHESCEDGTEKDVIVHEVNEMNKSIFILLLFEGNTEIRSGYLKAGIFKSHFS